MRADFNTERRKKLFAEASGKNQRRCQSAREMAASPEILKAAVADFSGIIGVAGAGNVLQRRIILRPCVSVVNNSRKGGSGGSPVEKT